MFSHAKCNNYHLFSETEGNSVSRETAVEGPQNTLLSRGLNK